MVLIYIVIAFYLFKTALGQQIIGNIISTSTNQPCLSVGASLSNNSQQFFQCSTSTVMELSLGPTNSNQTSSTTYVFRALPDSTGFQNQNFFTTSQNPINPNDPINACLGNNVDPTKCISAINNNDLFQIEITISAIPARYSLTPTGLTIPSAYYYNSRPYALNQWTPTDTCGIDPYSDVIDTNSGYNNYAKLSNTIVIPKLAVTDGWGADPPPYDINPEDIYANVLLSAYALQTPGSAVSAPVECSDPSNTTLCSWGLTSIGPGGETSTINNQKYNVLDGIFNRFINGSLGTGGSISSNRIPNNIPDLGNSAYFCSKPIGQTNLYTVNVCPQDVLPNFQARQSSGLGGNAIYPAYCINGPCGGNQEAFCPLIAGFANGYPRCLMSRDSAITYMETGIQAMKTWPTNTGNNAPGISPYQLCMNHINVPFYTSGAYNFNNVRYPYCGTSCNIFANCVPPPTSKANWNNQTCQGDQYACVVYAYVLNQEAVPDPEDGIKSFNGAMDPIICGSYIAQVTHAIPINLTSNINYEATCPYPFVLHYTADSFRANPPNTYIQGKPNVEQSYWVVSGNSNNNNNQVNDVRQLVVPFQPYDGFYNIPVGISLSSQLQQGSNGDYVYASSPMMTTSPSTCAAGSGWQDTVIPVGPLCIVYSVSNPPTPLYEVNITIRSNDGSPLCTVTIGTAAGPQFSEIVSGACNNTMAAWLINSDLPRGNTLPILDGYFVVCGTVQNDEEGSQTVNNNNFFGGGDKSGLNNPWNNISPQQRVGRMPIPSTFTSMFGDKCTTNGKNNSQCAYWYYVPKSELNQYGLNCNQNGWMCYGAFSSDSTNTMCENSLGTCVPGYDTRNYNCNNYNVNSTDPLYGFPALCPTTKTPLFIANQFVDYEINNGYGQAIGAVPVNLPPNWNPVSPNWWIDGENVYYDGYAGEAFNPGDILVRLKLAVAGQLLTSATSFAPGKLRYSNDPTVTTQQLGSCNLYISSGGGSLVTFVQNTGTVAGTYSINGTCNNGASVANSYTFSVDVNNIVQVNLELGFTFQNGNPVTCNITLSPAFTNIDFDTLSYQCFMYNTINDAPGNILFSSSYINSQGINDTTGGGDLGGYGTSNYQDNGDCGGSNPAWWCVGMKTKNALMSDLWTFIALVALSVLMISVAYFAIGHGKSIENDFELRNQAMQGQLKELLLKKRNEEKATANLQALRKAHRAGDI